MNKYLQSLESDFFGTGQGKKKLKDTKARGGENEISDVFLALAGCEAIMNIYFMAYPKQLQNFIFVNFIY